MGCRVGAPRSAQAHQVVPTAQAAGQGAGSPGEDEMGVQASGPGRVVTCRGGSPRRVWAGLGHPPPCGQHTLHSRPLPPGPSPPHRIPRSRSASPPQGQPQPGSSWHRGAVALAPLGETRTSSHPAWPGRPRVPRASWRPRLAPRARTPRASRTRAGAGARGPFKDLLRPPASFFSRVALSGHSTPSRPRRGRAHVTAQTSAPPPSSGSGRAIGCDLGARVGGGSSTGTGGAKARATASRGRCGRQLADLLRAPPGPGRANDWRGLGHVTGGGPFAGRGGARLATR